MKKVFFLVLAVIIVILVFSLGSFGVEAEAVLSGYENTRKYANDSKMLTVAVDTYKAEVEKKVEYENTIADRKPTETVSLGKYNELLTDADYEGYTDTLYMSSDKSIYGAYGSVIPEEDRNLGAYIVIGNDFNEGVSLRYKNYFTKNNTACDNTNKTELNVYESSQCAGFANTYVNQIAYNAIVIKDGFSPIDTGIQMYKDTCWEADAGNYVYLKDETGDKAKEFFTNVTPGTLVRTVNPHSYIILGADDEYIIIYDCNAHKNCGILLHKWTWAEFAYQSVWSTNIVGILSPPDSELPNGCLPNSGYGGTIINSSGGAN